MKITRLETLRLAEFPNVCWLRIYTDEGLTGLGEAFYGAAATEAYLHDQAAPRLSLHLPTAFIQETVRAFTSGWYRELVTELPHIENGRISVSDKPGLGLELLPDLHKRPDATVRESR